MAIHTAEELCIVAVITQGKFPSPEVCLTLGSAIMNTIPETATGISALSSAKQALAKTRSMTAQKQPLPPIPGMAFQNGRALCK